MHKPDRIIILAFQYYAKTSTKISENMLKQIYTTGMLSMTNIAARNILLTAKAIEYSEPLYLQDEGFKSGNTEDPFEKYRNKKFTEQKKPMLTLQPNPAKEQINISFEHCPGDKQLNIFNQKGQLMDRIIITEDTHNYTLNLGTYPAGTYIVQVYCNNTLVDARQFSIIK